MSAKLSPLNARPATPRGQIEAARPAARVPESVAPGGATAAWGPPQSSASAIAKQAATGFEPGPTVDPGKQRIDASNPWLRKLATSRLSTGADGTCVKTTLGNLDRLGVPSFEGGTEGDPNNSRGAMVQMLRNGHWTSLPLEGAVSRTIKSPYGTAQAHVVGADAYERMAKAGQVPSGAIIFQTRHGWSASSSARGNDMGIVRDGGKVTHNYKSMSPVIYGDAKEVVILVPKAALAL